MTSQKALRFGLLSLIGLELGLSLSYLAAIWSDHAAPHWLDFDGLRSLPSLLQALHLFAIGIMALVLLLLRHRMQRPLSWGLPLALALLCFYGGFDELTKIHLQLHQYNWKLVYLGILLAIPIGCWRDLVWLWQSQRSTLLWVLAGLGVFLAGGFGAEAIKQGLHAVSPEATIVLTGQQHSLLFLFEHIRITVEEFAELLGETLILFGVIQFMLHSFSSPDPAISV